jgi:hypothetical protein
MPKRTEILQAGATAALCPGRLRLASQASATAGRQATETGRVAMDERMDQTHFRFCNFYRPAVFWF